MPQVINPYKPDDSLASSLSALGAGIFGDQSKNEAYRQHSKLYGAQAESQATKNIYLPLAAKRAAEGDHKGAIEAAILGGLEGQNLANYFRLGASGAASSVDDPKLALSQMGAGQSFGSTAVGTGREEANKMAIAKEVSRRQLEGLQYGSDNTPEKVLDANGNPVFVSRKAAIEGRMPAPRSKDEVLGGMIAGVTGPDDPRLAVAQMGGGQGYSGTMTGTAQAEKNKRDIAQMQTDRQMGVEQYKHDNTPITVDGPDGPHVTSVVDAIRRSAPMSKSFDQVRADLIQPKPQQAQSMWSNIPLPNGSTPQAPAPSAMSNGPLVTNPDARSLVGLPASPTPMVDVRNMRYGISHDGGQTVTDSQTGQRAPVAGGGWQVAGPEAAVSESRNANIAQTAAPPTVPNWTQGQYAQSAQKAAGMDAFGQQHANALLGSLGMTKLFGVGEIGPEYERARANLDMVRQSIKKAFINSPNAPVREQGWVDKLMPTDAILTNPVTEANKVGTIVQHLTTDNQHLRQIITNPATMPEARAKAQVALMDNERALKYVTAPAPGAQQKTAPPPAAAPQAQGPGMFTSPSGNTYQLPY